MTTIASPRPSVSLSSRRGSASSTTTVTSTNPRQPLSASDRAALRRNRAALRDYYGLQTQANKTTNCQASPPNFPSAEYESELDQPGFDPEAYVDRLLSAEGTESILRTEAGLISDIRSLDGEKKALVYDNYSKLIAATDTIRNMREKMDPMSPTTNTLTPAIGHIAETAAKLSAHLRESHASSSAAKALVEQNLKDLQQRKTVRWALDAPLRIRTQKDLGEEECAHQEWLKVKHVLDKWRDVKGVASLRQACLQELQRE